MKKLTFEKMEKIQGGISPATAVVGIACGVALAGGLVGALIGGPTCLGGIIRMLKD